MIGKKAGLLVAIPLAAGVMLGGGGIANATTSTQVATGVAQSSSPTVASPNEWEYIGWYASDFSCNVWGDVYMAAGTFADFACDHLNGVDDTDGDSMYADVIS